MKGYLIVEDKGAKRTKVMISNVVDKAKLSTFATSFDSFCNGKIVEAAVIDPIEIAGTLQVGEYDSIEDKAVLTFRYKENGEKRTIKLAVPTPDDDIIEFTNGIGNRVTKAQGDALAAMLSTLTGKTVTFSKGTYLSKPTQAQV